MAKESLRGKAATQAFDTLMLTAGDARRTGRWAIGAEVLEQAAKDVIENLADPVKRQARIVVQKLEILKPRS